MGGISSNSSSGAGAKFLPEAPSGPEPPYELIRDSLKKGRVIPFLGAGASLVGHPEDTVWSSPTCNFLPKAWELAEYLDRRSGYPSNAPPELTRVAQYFEGVAGRQGLDDELRDVFAKRFQTGPLHTFLAGSKCRLLVTTNYDCMLEQAFEEKGRFADSDNVKVYPGNPAALIAHAKTKARKLTADECKQYLGLATCPQ